MCLDPMDRASPHREQRFWSNQNLEPICDVIDRCWNDDTRVQFSNGAVHADLEASRAVYNFVVDLCVKLGANWDDLVPFEKYAAAAQSLTRPSSAARALNNGVPNIERADKLVQLIAAQQGLRNAVIDATVARVDARLEANRKKAAA